jgi:hypothetical protein
VESLLPFAIVAVVLVVAALLFSRRGRRDTGEVGGPVRLGPSWSPPDDDLVDDPEAVALRERDLSVAAGAVDLDERAIQSTLDAWWEYLSVLRVRPLPRGHRYRFYDPYDPPITELGPDGPVPDPVRVARDVAQRTSVPEIDAVTVLNAVLRERGPIASTSVASAPGEELDDEPTAEGFERGAPADEPRTAQDRGGFDDAFEDDVLGDDELDDPDEGRRH